MARVKISPGNMKMGAIPSVSLPSGITCRECTCIEKCYARRLERLRPNVKAAYQANLDLLCAEPNVYWREVEAHIMMSRYFRFHVSGDIPNEAYLHRMAAVATRNPHCDILCFTKKYELINEYLSSGLQFPQNLHIIFSGWPGLEMKNPFSLPEAHVRFRCGMTTASENASECSGNCTECAITEAGCWVLQNGQQVVFNEH